MLLVNKFLLIKILIYFIFYYSLIIKLYFYEDNFMSIWGKILGGSTGMVLGGPLGAVLGLALGHKIDKIRSRDSKLINEDNSSNENISFQQYNENEKQLAFASGVIVIAAKLSKADGKVTQDEIIKFREVFDFDPKDEVAIGKIFNNAKKSSEGFEVYARQLVAVFGNQQELYIEFINSLYKIAFADGELHINEDKMIKDISIIFNMPIGVLDSIKSQYITIFSSVALENDYKILLSKSSDSDAEIKKKYFKLVKEYHPDSLVSKGLPEEFLKFANERLANINEAYERITKFRKDKI
ncbi:MAG: molecular chaperone DjiA [Alphaproteobacteria bacterium]|nr:MAG: molecular chaperone DjiA [Alphaproteobacteria bacterium]